MKCGKPTPGPPDPMSEGARRAAMQVLGAARFWATRPGEPTPVGFQSGFPLDQLLAAVVRSNGITGAILNRYVYGFEPARKALATSPITNASGNFQQMKRE
jgi:hypothetical protein